MSRIAIHSDQAPKAIGPYSQAVQMGELVFLTGQIALHPEKMELAQGIEAQTIQVLENLQSVAQAAGGGFSDVGKLTIYLTELSHFGVVNEIMSRYFEAPYPARATVGVSALALNALIAIDATLVILRKTE
ncbi:Rid family detoxifying hydrolase [Pseudomonas sichuanensis]|uniref:Rid family detoxifying hydrolase n=1 Tax=Pseudomonas sichuanensis TaxID=2213015 RepID=UPI00244A9AC9|nr:Rid family detoxifying hydrolase [Pseudomonas sichuanensis]MDH0731432.1 Rid family detoxifying hydrolase [Pseudomonas sichuanensis]MDH1584040.1 Rid family detoxifying hydrolase [Pseudomonas sichuanensis]MDH1591909.1 Rid family detoxifying hydrolase [Pseudomonas sichuanensis]MDH1597317.1 Rid family detoxifying hydrolase [Pseudomonas sichuanensis]